MISLGEGKILGHDIKLDPGQWNLEEKGRRKRRIIRILWSLLWEIKIWRHTANICDVNLLTCIFIFYNHFPVTINPSTGISPLSRHLIGRFISHHKNYLTIDFDFIYGQVEVDLEQIWNCPLPSFIGNKFKRWISAFTGRHNQNLLCSLAALCDMSQIYLSIINGRASLRLLFM